jgi:hypothetical protein
MMETNIGDNNGVRIKEKFSFNSLFFIQILQKLLLKIWYILYKLDSRSMEFTKPYFFWQKSFISKISRNMYYEKIRPDSFQ